ncbi:unnamed protein product, partial [Pylaiella littoralis]
GRVLRLQDCQNRRSTTGAREERGQGAGGVGHDPSTERFSRAQEASRNWKGGQLS